MFKERVERATYEYPVQSLNIQNGIQILYGLSGLDHGKGLHILVSVARASVQDESSGGTPGSESLGWVPGGIFVS